MSTLDEIEAAIATLPRADRARLAQRLVGELSDTFPGIESTPGVAGGDPCIVRTRMPVWLLERVRRAGIAESSILADYPTLTAQDLVNAWAYAAGHRAEIDRQIEENDRA